MKLDKKMLMYLGLGGLAVYFLFFRKKNKPATEEEMSNFLTKRDRQKTRAKLKGAKAKLISWRKKGGVSGAVKRKLVGRVKSLATKVQGGRKGARRRNAIKKSRSGGFFGQGCD